MHFFLIFITCPCLYCIFCPFMFSMSVWLYVLESAFLEFGCCVLSSYCFTLGGMMHCAFRVTKGTTAKVALKVQPQLFYHSIHIPIYSIHVHAYTKANSHSASSASFSRNPFVETTLQYALTYLTSSSALTTLKPLTITILADNDYYSTTPTPSTSSSRFSTFPVPLSSAHKTGLGSSAALVTALTSALLTHHLPVPPSRATLHNLAQAAHCAAQGKVGSGFDVAAAVYGTCIYRRFSPSILSLSASSPTFAHQLKHIVDDVGKVWDTEIIKEGVKIPDGMTLVMCDVDCGSQTVGMVKQVLAWRQIDPETSTSLWDALQTCNTALATALASTGSPSELAAAFAAIREKIRKMGELSNVPIEPPAQTELLDALTAGVEGVVGGVVPGAGGYDAVALLIRDDEETKTSLTAFLQKWSEEKMGNVKLLGAKGELEGAKVEDWGLYKGFGR